MMKRLSGFSLGAYLFLYFCFIWLEKAKAASTEIEAEVEASVMQSDLNIIQDPVTSVSQLSDITVNDWSFQALGSLINQYRCIVGDSNQLFQGQRSLTRYEFAAALNQCLQKIQENITQLTHVLLTQAELETVDRLQTEFANELDLLQEKMNSLERRVTSLEAQQFSTTTQLRGQVIFAINAGSFQGNRILSPTGAAIAEADPSATTLYRVSLFFNTSFQGTDQLQVRLTAGSDGADDNAAGFLEPNFASTLDFAVPGRTQFTLGRLFYTFSPTKDLTLSIGPRIVATDYVDRNRYANNSFLDFSTQALVNNFILFPRPLGAGIAIDWHPEASPLKIRGVYVAGNAASFNTNPDPVIEGPRAPELLFPNGGGQGGLFGDPYQGIVELEYSTSNQLTLRLQYTGGIIFGSRFNVFGANAELALTPKLGVFGRFGYGTYLNSTVGDVSPYYWMAGMSLRDVFLKGSLAGIAVGQPFVESNVGNATQTNLEAFYNVPLNDNIRITPLIQVITKAGNQDSNGIIITGTIRTVFSF